MSPPEMVIYYQSEEEFEVLHNSLSYLRFHFLWPPKGESFTVGRYFYLKLSTALALFLPVWIMTAAHLANIFLYDLDVSPTEDVTTLVSCIGFHYILFNYMMKQDRMAKLYQKLSDFKRFGKPTNFDKTNLNLNRLSLMYRSYCIIGIIMYGILAVFEAPKCEKINKEKGLSELCGLYVPTYSPVEFFGMKQLLWVYQFVAISMIIPGSAAISFSTFETAEHIVARIEHLNELLEEMFDVKLRHVTRLYDCIRYHQFLLEISEDFDSCYKNVMGCYVMMTGTIFGCIANLILEESSIGALIHLVGWIIALYVVCHAGQALISSSETITRAAFGSKWYEAKLTHQKVFITIMLKSQRLIHLHGAPLGVMSFTLFVTLLKSSYSYLMLLNQKM